MGRVLLATDRTPLLAGLAGDWTRGAVKAVPPGLVVGAGFLRVWTLAAGRPAEIGFLLGLDPHAPDTHEPMAAACAASGLTGSLLGVRGGGPAVRIVGYRRCSRLAEMIGTPPPEAPPHPSLRTVTEPIAPQRWHGSHSGRGTDRLAQSWKERCPGHRLWHPARVARRWRRTPSRVERHNRSPSCPPGAGAGGAHR